MATSKKVSVASANATSLVRFSVGADEIRIADEVRTVGESEALAFKRFYDEVIKPHGVPLSALKPLPKGKTRSNEETAAYDFGKRIFYVLKFGAEITAQLYDKNVGRETVLPISQFIGKNGKPYVDQKKHAIQASFGGTPWKEFVARLEVVAAEGDTSVARGKSTPSDDMEYVKDRIGAVIKRLRRDVEKMDGSISVDVAPKLAAFLEGALNSYGIK